MAASTTTTARTTTRTSSGCLKLMDEVRLMQSAGSSLMNTMPAFCDSVGCFADEAQAITKRWRECSRMLSKHSQLLELLEIPQVMDNCIRSDCYDEALKLFMHVHRCRSKYPGIRLLDSLAEETEKMKQLMTEQLLKDLRGNSQLPQCLRIVSLLRKMHVFSETEIRIKFLTSRDLWMESLMTAIPSSPAILHLTKFIDVCRVNLFDTVTQYKAIFPSTGIPAAATSSPLLTSSSSLTGVYDTSSSSSRHRLASSGGVADVCQENDVEADFTDCKILTSWLLQKIDSCLQIITNDLLSVIETEPYVGLDSVIDPCFYFGLSLTRIGADIRPRLLLIFNNVFLRRFRRVLNRATNSFLESLNKYDAPAAGFNLTLPVDSHTGDPDPESSSATDAGSAMPIPPQILLQFEPLAVFLNSIISALNEIRAHVSIMNLCKIRDAVSESLVRGTDGIHSYCRCRRTTTTTANSSSQEWSRLSDHICTLYVSYFLTHVREIFGIVFHPELLTKSLGISLLDFMRLTSKDTGLNLIQINAQEHLLDEFRLLPDDSVQMDSRQRNFMLPLQEEIPFQEGSPAKLAFSLTPVVDPGDSPDSDCAAAASGAAVASSTDSGADGSKSEESDILILQAHNSDDSISSSSDNMSRPVVPEADDESHGQGIRDESVADASQSVQQGEGATAATAITKDVMVREETR